MEKKIEFLHSAISDAQELIKFIDTKTAVAITILGAYIVAFFSSLEKLIEYSFGFSFWFWFIFSAFIILLVLCIIVTARIIKPTNNPDDNINFGKSKVPSLKYFLTPNDYSKGALQSFTNSKEFKLKENFEAYLQQLETTTDNDILASLTFELFKVSFIRNIKNDRFNSLLLLLLITTGLFFVSYLLFTIESNNIIGHLKSMNHHCHAH